MLFIRYLSSTSIESMLLMSKCTVFIFQVSGLGLSASSRLGWCTDPQAEIFLKGSTYNSLQVFLSPIEIKSSVTLGDLTPG